MSLPNDQIYEHKKLRFFFAGFRFKQIDLNTIAKIFTSFSINTFFW